ncbi:Sodium/proton antiporter 1 [Glycine max]|nr:Sodium/proton antiporter 1 [Glycine max]
MATFSIGTHLPMFQHLHNSRLPLLGLCTVESSPFFGSSSCRTRFAGAIPTLLRHNVLARAEDKARDPTPSSFQPQQSSQQQFQNLTPESGSCDPLCSLDETSSQEFEDSYQPKTDFLKAVAILATAATGAVAINHSWVATNQDLAMALLFVIGYAGIIFEESLAFNKSGVGLLMAVSLWVIRSIGAPSTDIAVSELTHASAEVSEIVFFLLGAMTIVEIVDAHQGFKLVTDNITTRNPRLLLWVIGIVTFFLSSVLDNLTSTIVMVSLLRKLVPPSEYRKILGAVVVIAANAGGAWTPIGDVTTTMLWIHGQISTVQTVKDLFVPSAVSLAVPLALMSLTSEVNGKGQNSPNVLASEQIAPRGQLVFSVGLGALIFVPVFKALTGLPPYMGMLLGLGVLWILTDAIHYGESERQKLKVPQALSRIDTQGVLFFLGILLSVSSLEAAGILREIANYLDAHVPSSELIASTIGLISAVIDNVPLVAATMGMYDVTSFPQDSEFWQLIAFCAGTGGSMLIIGSAAGVAFMGMEKVDFFWYLRKISGFAFAGYAAGIVAYLALHKLNISLPTLAEIGTTIIITIVIVAIITVIITTNMIYTVVVNNDDHDDDDGGGGGVGSESNGDNIYGDNNHDDGNVATTVEMGMMMMMMIAITVSILLGNVQSFDGGSLCEELIIPSGYPCSEYTIQTKDGFLLGLQRVSSSSSLRLRNHGDGGPPVLLLHGLFMAGDAWFLNTPEQSLGFILADHGFDVWVGNVRGTRWSHGHISLLEKKKQFWDWSWQELALYDVAEMINYINSVTNSKIFVVGHSQGTIISLAAFTQPEIVEKVEAAALLSPISYLDHVSAPLVLRMVKMHIDEMILTMGIHQLNFKSEWGASLLVSLCDTRLSCNDMLSSITGKNCCFNESRVEFYLEQEPHPSSSKNLNHLFQSHTSVQRLVLASNCHHFLAGGEPKDGCTEILVIYLIFDLLRNQYSCAIIILNISVSDDFVCSIVIRKGTYSKYDYGKLKNLIEYGKFNPPKFDLSRIPKSLPLWMAYGGNDALADITDFQHTLKELPSPPEVVYLENYGHVDFILSLQAKQDLYDPMISFFKSSGKFSSM